MLRQNPEKTSSVCVIMLPVMRSVKQQIRFCHTGTRKERRNSIKMWSLQTLIVQFIICTLNCVTNTAEVIRVFGYEGRDAHVPCSYPPGYESYEKYLCKNNCGNDADVLIKTTVKSTSKFSINDDTQRRVYTTTISDLRSDDAGKYWCGVTRPGKDYYPGEVRLTVAPDSCCVSSTKMQSYEDGSVSITCPYASEYQRNMKYICRGNQPSTCWQQAIVTSNNKQNNRFSLTDDMSKSFTVTITSLTRMDSGSYLCGIQRINDLDVFSAVQLKVQEWCCVTSTSLTSGIVGRPLTMRCPYPPEHRQNTKFLCKGESRKRCSRIEIGRRFSIQDNPSSLFFSVMITDVKVGDAGMYWCGSDPQWRPAKYLRIQLSVAVVTTTKRMETVRPQTTHIPSNITVPDASIFSSVVFTGSTAGAAILLLTLIVVLVIVCKGKCHKAKENEVNIPRNISNAANAAEVYYEAEIYGNEEVIANTEKKTTKPQMNYNPYNNRAEDQPHDSVYENYATAESIYCNQF